jgi:hypothetical protein
VCVHLSVARGNEPKARSKRAPLAPVCQTGAAGPRFPRAWLLADHPRKQRQTIQRGSVCQRCAWAHSILLHPTILQGIRLDREGQRAKTSIKEVLEQRRINMATGALVNELFSNCTPETLSKKIRECFREFDRDNSGGLDRSRSVSLGVFFPSSPITIVVSCLFHLILSRSQRSRHIPNSEGHLCVCVLCCSFHAYTAFAARKSDGLSCSWANL